MATTVTTFSGRDFTAEYERMVALLREWLAAYTDNNHSDPGMVYLRLFTSLTDGLNFQIDHSFLEMFVDLAQFKQSLIDIGKCVTYLPTIAAPATTRFRLERIEGVEGEIAIPQFSPITRPDGAAYLAAQAVSIHAGSDTAEIDGIQGTLITEDFEAADFTLEDWSGHPRLSLGASVAGFTCELWHGSPEVRWVEVDSFWRSQPTDYHFALELNGEDDTVWLVLGDGIRGQLPPDETLHVRFIRTDEAAGNCGTGVITRVLEEFEDLITATNIRQATGGAAAEHKESIRRMIPRMTRTQRRGLTPSDYEALIEHLPGVLHVQAMDRNNVPGEFTEAIFGEAGIGWPHEYTVIVAVPDGGGPMSSYLKNIIWNQCCTWGHHGNWRERYILLDAQPRPTDVAMRIGVLPGSVPDAVCSAAVSAILAVMAPENRTIGGPLPFLDLHRTASAVAGVSWVEFDTPRDDVPGTDGFLVTPGSVTAVVG